MSREHGTGAAVAQATDVTAARSRFDLLVIRHALIRTGGGTEKRFQFAYALVRGTLLLSAKFSAFALDVCSFSASVKLILFWLEGIQVGLSNLHFRPSLFQLPCCHFYKTL